MIRIEISEQKKLDGNKVLDLYRQNNWSSANKPKELLLALENSHALISAWDGSCLVGLANAISDGYLVVYYPHLLILPSYQGLGIGKMIMDHFQTKYKDFHQQILVADGEATEFYKKCGFTKAGNCSPMWIYQGNDHD